MLLRHATADDAVTIATLHATSWRDAYAGILDPAFLAGAIDDDRLKSWTARLAAPAVGQEVILAVDGPDTMGFVCLLRNDDPTWGGKVDNLHVSPALRGRGVGERLLRRAAGLCDQTGLYLWVFEANHGARRFYERMGASEVERSRSAIPSADGKTVLRLHWPQAADLAAS